MGVECWHFLNTELSSGAETVDSDKKIYAVDCTGVFVPGFGTEEPVAKRGFALLPPNECKHSFGCSPPPLQGYDNIPESCLQKANTQITQDHTDKFFTCKPALLPGEVCHPARYNWTTNSVLRLPAVKSMVGRSFCPYVMPCEPSEACHSNNTCSNGYISKYEAYLTSDRSDGALVCHPLHSVLPNGLCFAARCGMCDITPDNPHFRLEGRCVPCPAIPWLLPAGMVFVCLCGAVGMFLLNRSGINLAILSVGIDYFQTLSIVVKLFTPLPPGVTLPFDFDLVIKWMLVFQMDLDMTGPECALRGFLTYERKWIVKVLLPFLGGSIVAMCASVICARRCLRRCWKHFCTRKRKRFIKKRKHITNETPLSAVVISMTFSMIYFLYLTICRTALEIFNCKDTDPSTGRYYMVSQPLEECYIENSLQTRLTPYAIAVITGYGLGFPIILLLIFHCYGKKIMADQVLRAHDRGDNQRTNRFFFLRIAFGKVYYMFRPKYFRWSITVIFRKFALSVIFMIFNDDTTFQVAAILGIIFINFVLQVRFMPYMGVREKAAVIREEAEERILSEIKRLERAQLLVRINGKSYYELMHKMRLEIDEQERIMSKHRHDFFNLNTIETMLLGALVFLCLCAVMTNSKYLLERDYSSHSMIIVCVAIAIIVLTSMYFVVSVLLEIRSSSMKRKTRREMLWARIKSNSAKIRGMKGIKNIKKNNMPFSISNFATKSNISTKGKNDNFLILPPIKVVPSQQDETSLLPPVQSNMTEEQLSLPSSSPSSSKSIISSSSNAGTDSLTSENSDADVRFLLRSEVNNNAQSVRHEVSLIESNHSSRNISEDDSTSNSSGHSASSDSDSGRTPSHDSGNTSDDDAPTL